MKRLPFILVLLSIAGGCRTAPSPVASAIPEEGGGRASMEALLTARVPFHVVKIAADIADHRFEKKQWPGREAIQLPDGASRLVLTPFAEAPEEKNLSVAVYDSLDRVFRFEITPGGDVLVSPAALQIMDALRAATQR